MHRDIQPQFFRYREARGVEIDLIIEEAEGMDIVEIKSGATVSGDFFKNFERFPAQK